MAALLFIRAAAWLEDTYNFLMIDLADPRTNDWFLVKHPIVFPLIAFYVYMVTKVGPRLMQDREPFQLKKLLVVYNFIQVCVSVYIIYDGYRLGWFSEVDFQCEPIDFSLSERGMGTAEACHVYYLAKLSELLDTVFFVLRKKEKQVSFLHLYHHAVMPMVSWGCVKYFPGGHGTFIGMVNSFVHVVMYTYYMLAAMGPELQKYLWWKKYITTMQQIQFCAFFLHSMQLLFHDCGYPRWTTVLIMPNAIFFYFLFNDFYKKSYAHDNKVDSSRTEQERNGYINASLDSANTIEKSATLEKKCD